MSVVLNGPMVMDFIQDDEAFESCVTERFAMLDVDGNGLLSRKDFRTGFDMLSALDEERQAQEEIEGFCDLIFEKFDEDRSGFIDMEKFKSIVKDIMIALARGIGNSPVLIALARDSLFMKVFDREFPRN